MAELSRKSRIIFFFLLALLFFAIPIEHKYDKLFRFYSLTLVPHGLELPSGYDPKIYFYLSDILGLVFLTFGLTKIRHYDREKGALPLLIIFCCAVISIIASPFINYPLAYLRLLQFLTPLSLFFFLAHSSISKEKLFNIASWSIFSTALVQSFFAIVQYFSQHSLGLRIIGEQPLNAIINVPNGHRWLLDQWTNRIADSSIFRAMGTMPHPNPLGGLLAVSLLITVYLFTCHRKLRIYLAPAYLIQLFALGITFSRSALFAYAIGTIVWFIWMRLRQPIEMRAILSLILCSGLIVGTLLSEQIFHRGGIVNYTSQARNSDQVRTFYQNIAVRMIEKHPIIGVGYGQFSLRAPSYLPEDVDPSQETSTSVHNIFLLLAAEIGLPAMILFLCWIGWILWAAWRAQEHLAETGLLASALIAFLFIGCCDLYPIFFQQGKLLFFGIAGCLARFGFFPIKRKLILNER
ncbi:MAG: hypothetical protein HW387_286 [Parachlamydiales bacterium]|nr:hypothetical protein [Parachlamydiales bacterium]